MNKNIFESIAEAESQASAIKARAQAEADGIIAVAEKQAAEIVKNSEAECAELRRSGIKEAELRADEEYYKAIDSARSEAVKFADGLLENSENHVLEIVGRLTK